MLRYLSALLVLAIVPVVGCDEGGGYGELGLVPVTGKVTLDGNPLPSAHVSFHSSDGRSSSGRTDAEGNYTLQYDSVEKGTTPGPKLVRIRAGNPAKGIDPFEEGMDPTAAPVDPTDEIVPAQYNTASTLNVEVSSSSAVHNFDLKSKP